MITLPFTVYARLAHWFRSIRRPLGSLLLASSLSACLPTEGGKYNGLRVHVMDQAGDPVRGATVQPYGGWHWPERRAVGYTDANGFVEFSLPLATYHVHAFPPHGYRHADPAVPITYTVVEVGIEPVSVTLILLRD